MQLVIFLLSALLQNAQINIDGLNPVTSYIENDQIKYICNGESYAIISYDLSNRTISKDYISKSAFYSNLSKYKRRITEDDQVKSLVAKKFGLNQNGLSFVLGYEYTNGNIYTLYYEDEINPSLSIIAIDFDSAFYCQIINSKILDIVHIDNRVVIVFETLKGFSIIDYVIDAQ